MGRGVLYRTLATGGTAYFAASSDLSTLFEDLALVRPTELNFVPRIWDMFFQEYQRGRPAVAPAPTRGRSMAEMRAEPARRAVRLRADRLGADLAGAEGVGRGHSSTCIWWRATARPRPARVRRRPDPAAPGDRLQAGRRARLGYFLTDQPHPRGELLVKSEQLFPGYYKRPEVTAEVFDADGFYRTGDIIAELGPDQLRYLDRRNNVLKLSQGEFVTVSKLEAAFSDSPLVHQIYVYGNSARPYLLAVVVPTEDAQSRYDAAELKPAISESLQDAARGGPAVLRDPARLHRRDQRRSRRRTAC